MISDEQTKSKLERRGRADEDMYIRGRLSGVDDAINLPSQKRNRGRMRTTVADVTESHNDLYVLLCLLISRPSLELGFDPRPKFLMVSVVYRVKPRPIPPSWLSDSLS